MSKFCLAGIILYLFVIPQVNLYSQTLISEKRSPFSDGAYRISISEWITKGDFRMHGGPKGYSNTWELTHPIDGGMTQILFSYTEKKNSPYTINISLGGGNIRQGTIRDTDWNGNGVVTDLSYSTSNGETLGFSFTTDYQITDITEPYEFYLTFGYNYLDISSNYQDGHIVISGTIPVNIYAWQDRKWQIYNLLYQGLEIGVKGKSEILTDLLLSGSLGYAPFTMAEYKGTRYPGTIFKQKEHIVAYGAALSYELKLSYALSNQLGIDGGYRYNVYRTKGKDQADSVWSGSWEDLDTDFKGFFFGCSLQF